MTDNTPKKELQIEELNDVAGGHLEGSEGINDVVGGHLESPEGINDVVGGHLEAPKKNG